MSEYILERNYDTKNGTFSTVKREEIVRCRDCKHMETRGYRQYCGAHAGGYPEVVLDDFCSFGERKVDE